MIKLKRLFKKVLCLGLILTMATGCFKRDDLEGVDIYTTVYPVQYVTDYLYGKNSNVKSIYPAETKISEYELTPKQLEEYSKGSIFVYNGLTDEKGIARDLLNANKDLKIIDVSQGLDFNTTVEELWLNPSDFLMLAHNVKNGFEEYISNKYILEEIQERYEELKVLISSYDAEFQMVPENVDDTNILIASDALSFLSKYGFEVINIDEAMGEVTSATKLKARKAIKDGSVKYIYMLDNQEETELIKSFVQEGAQVNVLRSMTVLSEEDIKNGANYKTMMRSNIEEIKREVYED